MEAWALGLAIASLRLWPLLLWLPVGAAARGALLGVGLLWLGSQPVAALAAGLTWGGRGEWLARELLVGLGLRLAVSAMWGALQGAARLGGLPMAEPVATLAQTSSVADVRTQPSALWLLLGAALFFALRGADVVLSLIAHSYALVPLPWTSATTGGAGGLPTGRTLLALGERLFALTLIVALPTVALRLWAELAASLFLRSAPVGTGASGVVTALRPLGWLLTLLLGLGAAVSLWWAQGPSLGSLIFSRAGH